MASPAASMNAIDALDVRPPGLATQDPKLIAEDQQLDVLDVRTTTTANKQPEQSPNSEIQEGEEHAAILDSQSSRANARDRSNGTLQR